MFKLSERGAAHLLLPIILLLGLIAGVYLVTSGNPLKLFSKAANPPIVFKSLDGKVLPTNSNGVYQTTSPNVRVELTSTLGPPASISGPVSGPNKTGTVSYRTGFDPTQLNSAIFTSYIQEPTTYTVAFPNISGAQFYWVEFKASDSRLDRRSAQIEIVRGTISGPISPTPTPTLTPVAVFRLFNPRNGDHLYTVSAQERDSASKIGYKLEGTGFYAVLNAQTPYIPVYRFYQPRTGEHFYTADQNEANTVKKYGYTREGIAFYASAVVGTSLNPVYRLINKSSGFHFYTASESEKNSIINSGSYKLEGVAFYAPTPSSTPTPTPRPTAIPTPTPTPSPLSAKRAFITGFDYPATALRSGQFGADAICQGWANNARLGGTWMAWISYSTSSVASRFSHHNGPYQLLNGITLANNWSDLTDGSIRYPFQIGVDGKGIGNTTMNVWTGTATNGLSTVDNCNNWTSTTGYGTVGGLGSMDSWWTQSTGIRCDSRAYIYCFEQ